MKRLWGRFADWLVRMPPANFVGVLLLVSVVTMVIVAALYLTCIADARPPIRLFTPAADPTAATRDDGFCKGVQCSTPGGCIECAQWIKPHPGQCQLLVDCSRQAHGTCCATMCDAMPVAASWTPAYE